MPNTSVQAAAEGLPTLNRRKAMTMTGLAAVVAAMVPATVALAASEPEHPWVKARRLAKELADVLNEGDGDIWDGPCGEWFAEIYPSRSMKYPVGFGSLEARRDNQDRVSQKLLDLIAAQQVAWKEFGSRCGETDSVLLGREPSKAACKRWHKALKAEERAMLAVCAFSAVRFPDREAKARFLEAIRKMEGGLQDWHVAALLDADINYGRKAVRS